MHRLLKYVIGNICRTWYVVTKGGLIMSSRLTETVSLNPRIIRRYPDVYISNICNIRPGSSHSHLLSLCHYLVTVDVTQISCMITALNTTSTLVVDAKPHYSQRVSEMRWLTCQIFIGCLLCDLRSKLFSRGGG